MRRCYTQSARASANDSGSSSMTAARPASESETDFIRPSGCEPVRRKAP